MGCLKIEFHLGRYKEAWPVLHISLLVMNRLNKTESGIFISLAYSLLSKNLAVQHLLERYHTQTTWFYFLLLLLLLSLV